MTNKSVFPQFHYQSDANWQTQKIITKATNKRKNRTVIGLTTVGEVHIDKTEHSLLAMS